MTKKELKRIEVRASGAYEGPGSIDRVYLLVRDDIPTLITEMRRLQNELESAQWEMCNLSE